MSELFAHETWLDELGEDAAPRTLVKRTSGAATDGIGCPVARFVEFGMLREIELTIVADAQINQIA